MRHLLHKAIVWYLGKCGGAFHCYEYGDKGRYVVCFSEKQYHTASKALSEESRAWLKANDFWESQT